jgi:heme-binding protein
VRFGGEKKLKQEMCVSKKSIRIGVMVVAVPLVLFLAIQLIPVWLLQTDPPVVAEPQWDSSQTQALAKRACYDCHSNQTSWSWYSRVAPISWLVTLDTIRGRRHLNFSEWGGTGGRRIREIGEVISEGSMPPQLYVLTHPAAQLTEAEKQQLISGLQASLK